jgi:hypothetical protein
MEQQEYTDGYQPQNPELIPGNRTEAHLWITAAITAGVNKCDKQTFLKAWWAFAWLNPGFHPDDFRQWDEIPYSQQLTQEAIRRVESGDIDGDDEYYAAEATHNAVWLERCGSPFAPSGFKDGYVPRHPELIPADEAEAKARLDAVSIDSLSQYPKETFLSAWWAYFWLNPGLNPEYDGEWDDDEQRKLAEEAFRRFKAGDLTDEEMFPSEVCHARILAEQAAGTPAHKIPHAYDRLVVILTDDGQYLSREGKATASRNEAARYYMIADRVSEQIDTVKKLYGRTMTTQAGR